VTSHRDLPLAACAYTAFYCEENIWQLTGNPALVDDERVVLIITNPTRTCLLWQQHAAALGQPVVWDYHVVLVARSVPGQAWQVYDFDTRLAFPSSLDTWLGETFPGCDQWLPDLLPHFRVVPAADFRDRLVSDRGHMKTAGGGGGAAPPAPPPRAPPPPHPLQRAEQVRSSRCSTGLSTQRWFLGLAWDLHMHAAPMQIPCKSMQIPCKYHARKPCSDFCDMQVHMQAPVLACICICKPMQANASPMQVPSFIMQTHETGTKSLQVLPNI
jgi:hypothetical protein